MDEKNKQKNRGEVRSKVEEGRRKIEKNKEKTKGK